MLHSACPPLPRKHRGPFPLPLSLLISLLLVRSDVRGHPNFCSDWHRKFLFDILNHTLVVNMLLFSHLETNYTLYKEENWLKIWQWTDSQGNSKSYIAPHFFSQTHIYRCLCAFVCYLNCTIIKYLSLTLFPIPFCLFRIWSCA